MPPDFEKLPEPASKNETKKLEEKSNLEELILKSENNVNSEIQENIENTGSLEKSIIDKIKNN